MNIINRFLRTIYRFFKAVKLVLKYGEGGLFKDTLTGVYTRILLKELVEREISRAKRYGHNLCLLMIDVDNLKEINKLGHLKGDKALINISDTIKRESRKTDLIFRWGGDEFIILMPEAEKSGPSRFIKRVSEGLDKFSLSVTTGITFWKEGLDLNLMIGKADIDLLTKKEEKKMLNNLER